MPRSRPVALSGALAAVLLLGACTPTTADPDVAATPSATSAAPSSAPPATAEPTASATPSDDLDGVPAGLEDVYDQEVTWESCNDRECAEVEVPVDYAEPGGDRLTLALTRLPAGGEPQGSLLVNPGGPGSSGIELVDLAPDYFGADLLSAYDVVGFDPRGVGDSTPVDCVSDAELDRLRGEQYDLDTDAGLRAYRADAELIVTGCRERSGDLARAVGTEATARDMDVLRHVLGERELDYLGFSYGTFLGATYADLFPERVGRFVLDGAMDPALSAHETTLAQAVAFEESLEAYVADCQAGPDCPLTGDVASGVAQVRTLLELAEDTPLPTADGRELTSSLAFSGIITPLYDRATWFALTSALQQAMVEEDGSQLLFLADLMAGRESDGTYPTNSTEANWVINCRDYPVEGDLATWKRQAEELAGAAPTFGPFMGYGEMLCDAWPDGEAAERAPLSATGAAPILVVGTTGDPATPYAWAESLTDQLESATLLTYDGHGHTAYGRSNECVTAAVDGYLVEGVVPAENAAC